MALLGSSELAKRLGVSRNYALQLARKGQLPAGFRVGDGPTARRRWDAAEIDAWIASRRAAAAQQVAASSGNAIGAEAV